MSNPSSPPDFWIAARDAAIRAALSAWRTIEPIYHGDYAITDKIDGPCTDADRAADRLIVEELRAAFPYSNHAYLTEESEDDEARRASRFAAQHVWIIDPIDGTKDFIKKNGNFAIHIGLVERSPAGEWIPVAAVVYRPVAGQLYSAVRGGGAWRSEVIMLGDGTLSPQPAQQVHVSRRDRLEMMRSVVSNSHRTSRLTRLIESLGLEGYWHIGSLGIKVCQIAEGNAELYVNLGLGKTKEWDTCAPLLIVQEAGGMMTDLDGAELKYNQPDVKHMHGLLASNGARHAELSTRIAEFVSADRAREAAAQS